MLIRRPGRSKSFGRVLKGSLLLGYLRHERCSCLRAALDFEGLIKFTAGGSHTSPHETSRHTSKYEAQGASTQQLTALKAAATQGMQSSEYWSARY